jgi:uncharacterized protein (DUF2141 family)
LALLQSAPLAATDGPVDTTSVGIALDGLRSTRGNVLVCVTRNPDAFPDCSRDPLSTRLRLAAGSAADMRVAVPSHADYAVAIIHDENGNGRLDTMLAIPREGFGFSRNPRLRMGPPRFSEAAFRVNAAAVDENIRVRYML